MSACSSAGDVAPVPDGPWVGTVSETDGVTTVVNESGSVWGGAATVVEEATIGGAPGSEGPTFGDVASVYEAGGTIYVIDAQAPAVHMFDHGGNPVGRLGPAAEGPGAYSDPFRLVVGRDRRVFLSEPAASRIHVFAGDDSPAEVWSVATSSLPSASLVFGADGVLWVPVGGAGGAQGGRPGMQAMPDGEPGDRVVIEQVGGRPAPADGTGVIWTPSGAGEIIVGRADAPAYRFEVQRLGRTELVIERAWQPTETNPEFSAWFLQVYGRERPPALPPYLRFAKAASGEIWVTRPANARRVADCQEDLSDTDAARANPCWVPAFLVDVFGEDGRHLGEIELPDDIAPFGQWMHIDGDMLIARSLSGGVYRVKRFRIVLPRRDAG